MNYDYIWQTPEYTHRIRSTDWYWIVSILAITGIVIAVIFGNILFAVVIALGYFSIILYSARVPKIIKVGVNSKGILVDNLFYPYENIKSFRIDFNNIVLHTKKMSPSIYIPVADQDEDELKTFLLQYLTEHSEEEMSAIETIANRIGF